MIKQQFHCDQSVSSSEFEKEIYAILTEVNAHMPRFVTRSDTPSKQKLKFNIRCRYKCGFRTFFSLEILQRQI